MALSLAAGYALGAGVSGISSLIANSQNKRMADYGYKKEMELLKYQNEYNNPVNQMSRLKSAGLNPHLVYGSGNVTGNLTGSLPNYQTPEMRFDTGISGQSVVGALQAYQDIELRKATEDKVYSGIVTDKMKQANMAIANLRDMFELNKAQKLEPYQLDMAKMNVQKSMVDIDNALKTGKLRDSELLSKEYQRNLIVAQIGLTNASAAEKRELVKMLKNGYTPNTGPLKRILDKVFQDLGITNDEGAKIFKDIVKPGASTKPSDAGQSAANWILKMLHVK